MEPSNLRDVVVIGDQLLHQFYEPVLFQLALQDATATQQNAKPTRPLSEESDEPLLTDEDLFYCYVRKLAFILDWFRGGDSVTAVSVLRQLEGPEYVFGSNQRTDSELLEAARFLHAFFKMIDDNAQWISNKCLVTKLLEMILLFNAKRISYYLDGLYASAQVCIRDAVHRNGSAELVQALNSLASKATFPRDVMSNTDSKLKFVSNTNKVIKAIYALINNPAGKTILENANDKGMATARNWQQLYHFLGKLRSYRRAAEIISLTVEKWPGLAKMCKITPIASSKRAGSPRSGIDGFPLPVDDIVPNLPGSEHHDNRFAGAVQEIQRLHLDDRIHQRLDQDSFRPVVHAEILVHTYLLGLGKQKTSNYFCFWKSIGSSKPTCRLCSSYFELHTDKVNVRPTDGKLYHNWKLPNCFDNDGNVSDMAMVELWLKIAEKTRSDANTTLRDMLLHRRAATNSHSRQSRFFVGPNFVPSSNEAASQAHNYLQPNMVASSDGGNSAFYAESLTCVEDASIDGSITTSDSSDDGIHSTSIADEARVGIGMGLGDFLPKGRIGSQGVEMANTRVPGGFSDEALDGEESFGGVAL